MARPEIQNKQEYVKLLNLLARVNDAVDASSISDAGELERLWDAHNLANKFISYALTILHLLDDTKVQLLPSFPPNKIISFAFVSIQVLTRAAMEAFLVFHYVFSAPTKADEKNFRYWAYKAAGIAERQNFPAITEESIQKLKDEEKELDKLRERLKSNTVYQALTYKWKRRILKGEWRLLSWKDIAIDARFSKMLASHIYKYLSGSAHSSSLSVLQMTQALINKEPKILIKPSINTMNILTANMIYKYCRLFPRSQDVLTKDIEGSNFVEQWIQIGQRLDEEFRGSNR